MAREEVTARALEVMASRLGAWPPPSAAIPAMIPRPAAVLRTRVKMTLTSKLSRHHLLVDQTRRRAEPRPTRDRPVELWPQSDLVYDRPCGTCRGVGGCPLLGAPRRITVAACNGQASSQSWWYRLA